MLPAAKSHCFITFAKHMHVGPTAMTKGASNWLRNTERQWMLVHDARKFLAQTGIWPDAEREQTSDLMSPDTCDFRFLQWRMQVLQTKQSNKTNSAFKLSSSVHSVTHSSATLIKLMCILTYLFLFMTDPPVGSPWYTYKA